MSRHPIAYDRGELTNLQRKAAIVPRCDAKRVLVRAHLRAMIARVEPAIQPRLHKDINVRPNLCIEENRQPRIEQRIDLAVDQTGRRLLEMVKLEIDCPADTRSHIFIKRAKCQRLVDAVE